MPEPEISVVLSAPAYDDLTSIYRYLSESGSVATADAIYRQFLEAFDRLRMFPESGALRDDIRPAHRVAPVSSWTIWYRWEAGDRRVTVVRVLHGHMDVRRHLPD